MTSAEAGGSGCNCPAGSYNHGNVHEAYCRQGGSRAPFAIGSSAWPGLSKLAEECGEVVQVIGKILGAYPEVEHWDGTNLRDRLEEELADLSAAIVFVKQRCGLNESVIELRTALKLRTFERWHVRQNRD